MELALKGSLDKYLRTKMNQLSIERMWHYSSQISSGMEYLHSRRIIHRDLACRNVLLITEFQVCCCCCCCCLFTLICIPTFIDNYTGTCYITVTTILMHYFQLLASSFSAVIHRFYCISLVYIPTHHNNQ